MTFDYYMRNTIQSNGVVNQRKNKMSETRKRPLTKTDSIPLDDILDDGKWLISIKKSF